MRRSKIESAPTMPDAGDWNERVNRLVEALRRFRADRVFNQWDETDPDFDCTDASEIRRNNLRKYLLARPQPRYVFVGEAPSWRGTRFSGIPMTSERILLGLRAQPRPCDVIPDATGRRTSKSDAAYPKKCNPTDGLAERTATTVWKATGDCGLSPMDFVLWNALPWHPHEYGTVLSNRKSRKFTPKERQAGELFLSRVLRELYPSALPIAFGDYAACKIMEVECRAAPHPAERRGRFGSELRRLLSADASRQREDGITEAMDRVCAAADDRPNGFGEAAARRVLEHVEW